MSENLYNLFTTQFSTNLQLLLQQRGSKLRDGVTTGFHVGKQASPIQYVNPVSLRSPAGRFAPMPRVDTDFVRRWVFPQDGELPQLIDSFDLLRTIVDPKSAYATNAAYAVGRSFDDAIINAAFGTAYTGADANGLSGESFNTTNYSVADTFGAGATSVGLTVAKLIEVRRLFRHYHVDLDMESPTLVIGSQQEADLLNQVTVVSTEFNDRPVLVDGRVTRFLGFNIKVMERLQYASNVRSCIAYVPSGLYLGMWSDMQNRISIRNDLSGEPFQLYTRVSFGATRLEPGRVIRVQCADTTGADNTP